jgi:hypothetical protein
VRTWADLGQRNDVKGENPTIPRPDHTAALNSAHEEGGHQKKNGEDRKLAEP